MFKHIRENLTLLGRGLQAGVKINVPQTDLEKKQTRWRARQFYTALRTIPSLVGFLPHKNDTWASTAGKAYQFLSEVEAHTGVVFGHRQWFDIEAEAKQYTRNVLNKTFFEDSPAISEIRAVPRERSSGTANTMFEVHLASSSPSYRKSAGDVVWFPGNVASTPDGTAVRTQLGNLIYTKGEEQFESFLAAIWESYQNQVIVEAPDGWYGSQGNTKALSYRALSESKDTYVGRRDEAEQVIREFHACKIDGVRRTWMLLGPPGTGKTTFIQYIANRLGGRFMLISYNALRAGGGLDLLLLAKPDFVLLDDMDRMGTDSTKEALDTLGELGITCFLTANDIGRFDEATLRPGRIDRVIEFGLPTAEDRKALFESYRDQFKAPTVSGLDRLVELSQGLSHSHCKEIAGRLRRETLEEVTTGVETMHRLQKMAQDARAAKKS